jgi:ornithine cyclodeaminase/alanine dehydrogenase-like protein (mu-crystallin family)
MALFFLTEADVDQLVSLRDAVDAVERAFAALATGEAENVPRMRAKAPGVILHSMSAAAGYLGLVGWKNYCTTKQGANFLVGLSRAETGELAVLIEADRLGQLRTGAATGVAIKFLTQADVNEIGLFGSGYQAEMQLEAVTAMRTIRRVFVYSRDAARRHDFADRMSARLRIDVHPVEQPADAVRNLPLVITATTSRTPVFESRDVADGALVCAVGSNWLNRAEIDPDTVARAHTVVCDSTAACRHEAGDLALAADAGKFDWSQAIELGDVVAGKTTLPLAASGITIFKSVGLAIEDVALGAAILDRAKKHGIGRIIQ